MQKYIYAIFLIFLCGCANFPSKDQEDVKQKPIVILLGEAHNSDQAEILEYLSRRQPELVLLEIPSDLLNEPNQPVEEAIKALNDNFVGWKHCKAKKVDCLGFDMQGNDLLNIYGKTQIRQEKLANDFLKILKKISPIKHAQVYEAFKNAECGDLAKRNSVECDLAVEKKRDIIKSTFDAFQSKDQLKNISHRDAFKIGNDHWLRRNRAMAQNICRLSEKLSGKIIVVIVGSDHRYILKPMLEKCSLDVRDPVF